MKPNSLIKKIEIKKTAKKNNCAPISNISAKHINI